MEPKVAVGPINDPRIESHRQSVSEKRIRSAVQAVERAGGTVVPVEDANALVWLAIGDSQPLIELLDTNPGIRWVQLPWAGVENVAKHGAFSRPITFTCAKAAYGGQVGEHAFMLILASQRNVVEQARTLRWHETEPEGLEGKRVTVLGAGGIAETVVRLLRAAGSEITVLRRSNTPFEGADRTLPISDLHATLPTTDVLVLALALTPETTGLIGREELALLPPTAVLVNVARGRHIDTEALVEALQHGRLKAAGLDVTDPEPLPESHALWSMNNVLITSHCADSVAYVTEKLNERISDNVRRFAAGERLIGVVDAENGY